jgi:hypothetical protein
MLNIQIQELKKDTFFNGEDFTATAFYDDSSLSTFYCVYFTCTNSEEQYLLTTQTNKTRRFKSLDTIMSVIKDLELFNDLTISSLTVSV